MRRLTLVGGTVWLLTMPLVMARFHLLHARCRRALKPSCGCRWPDGLIRRCALLSTIGTIAAASGLRVRSLSPL